LKITSNKGKHKYAIQVYKQFAMSVPVCLRPVIKQILPYAIQQTAAASYLSLFPAYYI